MRYAVDVDRRADDVASLMFRWAQDCNTVLQFTAKCTTEERWVKSVQAGDRRVDKLPVCWTQAKSDIKCAWEQGHAPADHKSHWTQRQAKLKHGKALNTGQVTPDKASREAGHPDTTRDEALATGEVVDGKAAIPDDFLHAIAAVAPLSAQHRAKFIKRMNNMANQFRAEHEQRKRRPANAPPVRQLKISGGRRLKFAA
jgi:hypothetical protein